jgi:hypothetical protein
MSGRLSMWLVAVLCAAVCGFVSTGLASAAELPDGRGYEQVSPEEKLGTEVYQPPVATSAHYEREVEHESQSNTQTGFTFQAAADGSGLAYVEGPTEGGNEAQGYGGGNEYLATRSPDGTWAQRLLSPEGAPSSIFQAFTPNLSTAFVSSLQPLSPSAPGYGEENAFGEAFDTLYTVSTDGGEYAPFFSTKPPYRGIEEEFGTVEGTFKTPYANAIAGCQPSDCLVLEGASADYTHLLFAANDALTGASEGRPAAEGGPSHEFAKENNLYESVDGQLRLVNVLPNDTTHANAAFGGQESSYPLDRTFFSHVISADGSRIFWTDLTTGHIYMREGGTRTVEISPKGTYQTATPDGSTVFYTNGDLYAYEVESGHTTDLTPGVTVSQVVGESENDEYIYYVNSEKMLAVLHNGVSKQITTIPIHITPSTQITAEVTPDGHSIVFMQEEYKDYPQIHNAIVHRIEVYDADTETLHCASCTSLGTFGYLQESNQENVYQPRWISADGAHVFFVSLEGLVPQDINEEQDVYEWERPGTGGCTEGSGCVYLLSGGKSVGQSGFLDASESGSDVFIVTRENLDGSDEDGAFDAYDVRLGAQHPPVSPLCTGTGCQGIPSVPPIFATPSSVTFEGVGNFSAPAKETKAKPKPKQKKKAKPKMKLKHKKKKSKAKKSARTASGHRRSSSKGGRS